MAAWLNCNTPQGRPVATVLPNSIEMAISALGALEAGVPLAPVNPQYTPEEISSVFKEINPRWLITSSTKIHDILEAMKLAGMPTSQTGIIAVDDEVVFNGIHYFDDLLIESGSFDNVHNTPALVMVRPGDVQFISQRNLVANCVQVSRAGLGRVQPGDKVAAALPMFNCYGLTHGLLNGLSNGAEVVTVEPESTTHLINCLKTSKVNVLPTVSPMVRQLARAKDALSGLTTITVGGRPEPSSGDLQNIFRGEILQNYGPVEGPVLFQKTPRAGKDDSVGQVLPGTEAKIVKAGEDLPPMTEGEIWVRGPQVGDGTQWVPTGDCGYFDNDGWFFVTKEGSFSVGGLRVEPGELEAVLRTHDAVLNAAVFPHGAGLVAAVIPVDPYEHPSVKEICTHVASKLAPHKHISDVVFMSSLPRTSSGDLDRLCLSSNYDPNHTNHEFVSVQSI